MSGTTRVSSYQKGKTRKVKTNLDLLEQEIVSGSGICWAICKSAPHPSQPCQHPTTQFFTGRMPFLPPNQQRQSTEGKCTDIGYRRNLEYKWGSMVRTYTKKLGKIALRVLPTGANTCFCQETIAAFPPLILHLFRLFLKETWIGVRMHILMKNFQISAQGVYQAPKKG